MPGTTLAVGRAGQYRRGAFGVPVAGMRALIEGRGFHLHHRVFAQHRSWRPVVTEPGFLCGKCRSDGGGQGFARSVLEPVNPVAGHIHCLGINRVHRISRPTGGAIMELPSDQLRVAKIPSGVFNSG